MDNEVAVMAQATKTRLKATAYYQLPDYAQHDLIQLIDGEVVIGMPPIPRHQAIVGEILFLLMTLVKQHGGQAFTSPIEVYLDEHNIFEPDVLFLSPNTTCIVDEKRLVGAPDLVVEVLSPGTAKFDRQEKYQAYEQHGVGEYWIVDPVHEVVEVWTLTQGRFVRQGAYAGEDTFQSDQLAETISVSSFFPA
jgi:Uma2 family endonuclease